MTYNFNSELNPIVETLGLIISAPRFEDTKHAMIKGFNELGVDGENLYNNEMKLYQRYVSVFINYCSIDDEYDFYFNSDDSNFLTILITLIISNIGDIFHVDNYDDNTINKEVIGICNELFGHSENAESIFSIEQIVNYLEKIPLTESERWKILLFMRSPKTHLKKIASVIEDNFPAYEKAKKAVEIPLKKALVQFKKNICDDEGVSKLYEILPEKAEISPTLAMPVTIYLFENTCYCGVFYYLINKKNTPTDNVVQLLKALGDKSRFDILSILTSGSKYNLEIAEQMGLTTATMSHHMSILLSCGLVNVTKKNGRVHYNINKKTVENFIKAIELRFL